MARLPALVASDNGLSPGVASGTLRGPIRPDAGLAASLTGLLSRGQRRRLGVALALSSTDALVALATAGAAERLGGHAVFEGASGGLGLLMVPAVAGPIYGLLGLYGGYGPSPAERLRLRSWGGGVLAVIATLLAVGSGAGPARLFGIATTALVLVLVGFYAEVAVRGFLIRRGLWGAATAIVGHGADGLALAGALRAQPEFGFNPVGFIGRDTDAPGPADATGLPTGLPTLGTLETAGQLRHRIEVAIFCSNADFAANEIAHPGPLPFSRVVVAQDAQALQSLWLQTRTLGGVLGLEIRRDLYRGGNLWLKRVIDALLAWPATLLVAPVIGILALVIKGMDPGPAFYVQTRVGRMGKPIRVLKLRSMYVDAEQRLKAHLDADPQARREWERFFKLTRDPRILPGIGSFLRRSSLDELPQLWNVARGDMSLVGPRPFPAYHTDGFDPDFQRLRASVSPGLSGLWQVSSRSDGDLDAQKSQDSYYIRNWSIWLDLYILLATIPAVVAGSGAR